VVSQSVCHMPCQSVLRGFEEKMCYNTLVYKFRITLSLHIYNCRLRRGMFQLFILALSTATNRLLCALLLIAGSHWLVSVDVPVGDQGSVCHSLLALS
jgi:hypothetical protein